MKDYELLCVDCSLRLCIAIFGTHPPNTVNHCSACRYKGDKGVFQVKKRLRVKLTYFKPTGKLYGEGQMEMPGNMPLHELWSIIKGLISARQLPGLKEGHSEYMVHVEVPGHPHECPHILNADNATDGTRLEFLDQALNEGNGVYKP